ncbi:TPA: MgtC/SapB family protein [Candidatus Poribacteria bacterium]|nr:MgtC/SapB family protein [Candidatus Poribacteria bacterium]
MATNLDGYEFLLRLLLAIALGGLIGLEREFHGRAAGLRTHILVCLGSTIIMIASMRLYEQYADLMNDSTVRIDPGRIAAGIVTGIGFLGAGVILQSGNIVRGLTTAASVWFVAGVGIAIGIGLYILASEVTALALFVLFALKPIERYIHPDYYQKLSITAVQQPGLLEKARAICRRHKLAIKNYEILENVDKNLTTVVLNVKFKWNDEIGEILVEEFTHIDGVRYVSWKI